ncbi:unnamed protein product [Symbiodinium microadriaticum]|nr:unnamed protein product [Symbiodinium sp. KB8]CAE7899005.1 unnamed protein product [Symbiodinium microadriaticum]
MTRLYRDSLDILQSCMNNLTLFLMASKTWAENESVRDIEDEAENPAMAMDSAASRYIWSKQAHTGEGLDLDNLPFNSLGMEGIETRFAQWGVVVQEFGLRINAKGDDDEESCYMQTSLAKAIKLQQLVHAADNTASAATCCPHRGDHRRGRRHHGGLQDNDLVKTGSWGDRLKGYMDLSLDSGARASADQDGTPEHDHDKQKDHMDTAMNDTGEDTSTVRNKFATAEGHSPEEAERWKEETTQENTGRRGTATTPLDNELLERASAGGEAHAECRDREQWSVANDPMPVKRRRLLVAGRRNDAPMPRQGEEVATVALDLPTDLRNYHITLQFDEDTVVPEGPDSDASTALIDQAPDEAGDGDPGVLHGTTSGSSSGDRDKSRIVPSRTLSGLKGYSSFASNETGIARWHGYRRWPVTTPHKTEFRDEMLTLEHVKEYPSSSGPPSVLEVLTSSALVQSWEEKLQNHAQIISEALQLILSHRIETKLEDRCLDLLQRSPLIDATLDKDHMEMYWEHVYRQISNVREYRELTNHLQSVQGSCVMAAEDRHLATKTIAWVIAAESIGASFPRSLWALMACAEQDLWDKLERLVIGDEIHELPLGISELADSRDSAHRSFQRGWERFAARAMARELGAVHDRITRLERELAKFEDATSSPPTSSSPSYSDNEPSQGSYVS